MGRKLRRHAGDLFLEILADPLPLHRGRIGRAVADGLSQISLFQGRRHVHGHKAQLHAGLFVIETGQVDEFVLKVVQDVVVLHIVLGEDHHAVALPELLDGLPEGGDDPGVMIDGNGVSVVEDADGQRRDEPGEQPEQRVQPFGLEGPEIREGVVRHFLPAHHLPGAPDIVLSREVQLSHDGPVHLAVVAHDDRGLLGQLLFAQDLRLWVEQQDQPADHPVDPCGFLVVHRVHPFPKVFSLYHLIVNGK